MPSCEACTHCTKDILMNATLDLCGHPSKADAPLGDRVVVRGQPTPSWCPAESWASKLYAAIKPDLIGLYQLAVFLLFACILAAMLYGSFMMGRKSVTTPTPPATRKEAPANE